MLGENEEMRQRTIQLRAGAKADQGIVEGYITTFDDPYPIGPRTRESIKRDTFDLSKPVPMFYEHDWKAGPIGVSRSIVADDKGLLAEFELFVDESERARTVMRAMKAGAMNEFSVGFLADPSDITRERSADGDIEVINNGELLEVSVVVRGANPNTELVSTRATVPGVAPIDPSTGLPAGEGVEEEKPTRATVMAALGQAVADALELGMEEQLQPLLKTLIATLGGPSQPAPAEQPAPGAPAAPPAPPAAAPAQRSLDLTPSALRAIAAAQGQS